LKHFVKYLGGLLILAAACTSDEFTPADRGLDYFPLKIGFYQIYKVDSTGYSEVSVPKTLAYELMTEVTDSFPNSEGSFTYVISRYKRSDSSSPWLDFDTWSARINDREVVVSEGNIPYIKLTFPVKENSEWDGNKFNSKEEDEYEIITYKKPFSVGGTTFEQTITVEQESNDDFIVYLDEREEIFAKGAGLIYKTITQLKYCVDDNCRGQQVIESGTIYKQELIEYGNH
jgi:hypothetical protein